ncbi:MAG: ATP-binding protein [Pseudanabaenaceae cyanobacterium]
MNLELLDQLPTPACLLDADTAEYVQVNQLWQEAIGYPHLSAGSQAELEITNGSAHKKCLALARNLVRIANKHYWLVTAYDVSKYQQQIREQQQEKQQIEEQLVECSTTLQIVNELLKDRADAQYKIMQRLRRNRQFLQRFIASSPCILYIYDLERQEYVYINQDSLTRLGYDSLKVTSIDKLVHPEDIVVLTKHYAKCRQLKPNDTLVVEYRLVKADKTFRWYRSYDAVFEVFNQQVVQIVGVAIDITEQKLAEITLAYSEQKNRAILRAIPDLILRLRADGTCIECLPPSPPHNFRIIQNHLREVLEPEELQKHLQAIARALQEKKLQVCEQKVIKQGRVCEEEVYIVAVSEHEVLEIVRDISDRQAAIRTKMELAKQKEITELQRRFFAMLSHEFRTPLATILASAQLLQVSHQHWLDEKAIRNLKRIELCVVDALELLENMMTINRADAGGLQVKKSVYNLRSFTDEVIDALASDRQIVTNYPITFDDYEGWIDPFLMRRVLVNLLNNALKYSAPETVVTVNLLVSYKQDQAIWQITDQGIGIAPEDVDHIFTLGWRGQNAAQVRGSGLGLAVVQACLTAMGGTIAVNSKLGVGTTFTVVVPIAEC